MGDHDVSAEHSEQQSKLFMKALLADLTALEKIIESGQIESGNRRIGAEQEMFLVDSALQPKPIAIELLETVNDPRLTTETGKFNLEANLAPQPFAGRCLHTLEQELTEVIALARQGAEKLGGDVLLAGILPTIRPTDLTLDNLTPGLRYAELNRTIQQLRGNNNNIYIKGLDEFQYVQDSMMLEACCTSFQLHYQVSAQEFARLHNLAQVITAPLLAVAANAPLLLGHRLWHETRIPLFQHSVDERSNLQHLRGRPPRVSFGEAWVKDSVLEIFREEIARFRVVLTKHIEENSLAVLARGELPQLAALRLHNGTIWRWNRPCYGVNEGKAHLRIENRVLPAGPSIIDEVANAAFFFGLMSALPEEYGDVTRLMSFDDAKGNFYAAARHSLKAQFTWLNGQSIPAATLILEHLLPLAEEGLKRADLATEDIHRYLDVIEERVRHDQNGAMWTLRSLNALENQAGAQSSRERRHRVLATEMLAQQRSNTPVHRWALAQISPTQNWSQNFQTVGQFMSTDLFTVRPDDLIDLVACVMDWKHVRHVPVEDDEGHLLGLVSHRDLLHLMAQGSTNSPEPIAVKHIMTPNPVTATPQTPTLAAIELMRHHKVGCLPVIENEKLVGIVTAYDFLSLSAELIEKHLKENERTE